MNLLSDIITYIRRIIKSPSNAVITDELIIDYINRFWLMDVDARMQLFDLKTVYRFETIPGIDQYNMPLYLTQDESESQKVFSYPVYQGFLQPCFVNGIQVPFYTTRESFFNQWPNYTQALNNAAVGTGDITTVYQIQLPFAPAIPGHIDLTGVLAYANETGNYQDPILVTDGNFIPIVPVTSVISGVYFTATGENGQNITVCDSGQFLSNNTDGNLYGLLMSPGLSPNGNQSLPGISSLPTYSPTLNTVNYNQGYAYVKFPQAIPAGNPINAQCYFYEQGIPRSVFYYNNIITIRPPPDTQYTFELTAYLTPAAFMNTDSTVPFAYMAEYIARGAARKILSDTGDVEQFAFYEPLFREQEKLVWIRSQRIFTSTRTGTIFSELSSQSPSNNYGNGT